MKTKSNLFTSNVFLTSAVLLLLVSGCKKVDLGLPIGEGKNPVARRAVSSHNPNVPDSLKYPEAPAEEVVDPGSGTDTTTTNANPGSCTAIDYPIYAGAGGNDTTKGTNVGTASYSNDGENLYVTTTFPGPTCPEEIHLWAGADPATVNGNGGLPFGKFPYKLSDATCGTHTFTIPLSTIFPGETDFCDKNISIVLHAAMGTDPSESDEVGGQTAIAYGADTFGGSRWGWVATYPVCCDVAPISSDLGPVFDE